VVAERSLERLRLEPAHRPRLIPLATGRPTGFVFRVTESAGPWPITGRLDNTTATDRPRRPGHSRCRRLPEKGRGWPPLAPSTARPVFMGQVESQPTAPAAESSPPAEEPSSPSPAPASSSLEALAAGMCYELDFLILWVGGDSLIRTL
jgi:hypothetical protein